MHKGKIPDIVFQRMSLYLRIALSMQEEASLVTSSPGFPPREGATIFTISANSV